MVIFTFFFQLSVDARRNFRVISWWGIWFCYTKYIFWRASSLPNFKTTNSSCYKQESTLHKKIELSLEKFLFKNETRKQIIRSFALFLQQLLKVIFYDFMQVVAYALPKTGTEANSKHPSKEERVILFLMTSFSNFCLWEGTLSRLWSGSLRSPSLTVERSTMTNLKT